MKRGISSSLRPCLSVSPGHGLLKVSELVSVPSANDRSKLSSVFELSNMAKPRVFTCLYGLLTKVDDLKEKMHLVWVWQKLRYWLFSQCPKVSAVKFISFFPLFQDSLPYSIFMQNLKSITCLKTHLLVNKRSGTFWKPLGVKVVQSAIDRLQVLGPHVFAGVHPETSHPHVHQGVHVTSHPLPHVLLTVGQVQKAHQTAVTHLHNTHLWSMQHGQVFLCLSYYTTHGSLMHTHKKKKTLCLNSVQIMSEISLREKKSHLSWCQRRKHLHSHLYLMLFVTGDLSSFHAQSPQPSHPIQNRTW